MVLTDEELLAKYRETGDASFFQTLVRRYQNRIYSASVRILGGTEGAEEVVQDTFIKVHQNVDRFRHEATFAAWVFKIAHNMCMDILRHRQRRRGLKVVTFDPQIPNEDDPVDTSLNVNIVTHLADPAADPSQRLDDEEQDAMIAQSLQRLPDNQRTVLWLHDVEGFSYQQIADIAGTSIGTVRSRLHYGRLRLRELLEPYFSHKNISHASR